MTLAQRLLLQLRIHTYLAHWRTVLLAALVVGVVLFTVGALAAVTISASAGGSP